VYIRIALHDFQDHVEVISSTEAWQAKQGPSIEAQLMVSIQEERGHDFRDGPWYEKCCLFMPFTRHCCRTTEDKAEL
jgi:hypothetical protein